MTFLKELVASTREALQSAKREKPVKELRERIRDRDETRSFSASLRKTPTIGLIAEIKKASPSKGVLRSDFHPLDIARIYEEEGAAAISVLTEERFFEGSIRILEEVRNTVSLPILRKDFILEEYQIYEARAFGADAILLIAAILDESRLKDYQALAADLSMECLVEVHSKMELDRAIESGAPLIGINNRNLSTFETSIETTFRLLKDIPQDRLKVSESGIAAREDILRLGKEGADAVLIGETFMVSPDIRSRFRELFEDDLKGKA